MKYLLIFLTLATTQLFAGQPLIMPLNQDQGVLDQPLTPPHSTTTAAPVSFGAIRGEFSEITDLIASVEKLSYNWNFDYQRNTPAEVEAIEAIDDIYGSLDDLSRSFSIHERPALMKKVNHCKYRLMRAITAMITKVSRHALLLEEVIATENQPDTPLSQFKINLYDDKLRRFIEVFNAINAHTSKFDAVQMSNLTHLHEILARLDQSL